MDDLAVSTITIFQWSSFGVTFALCRRKFLFRFLGLIIPMGIGQFQHPTKSILLNRSTKNPAQLITSARGPTIPNFVEIRPVGAFLQMGEIKQKLFFIYLYLFCRAMLASSAAFAVMRTRCLSVCLSRSWVLSKQTYHQNFFTVGWPRHSSFSVPNGIAIFRRPPP